MDTDSKNILLKNSSPGMESHRFLYFSEVVDGLDGISGIILCDAIMKRVEPHVKIQEG